MTALLEAKQMKVYPFTETQKLLLEISNGSPYPFLWWDAQLSFSVLYDNVIDGEASRVEDADIAFTRMVIGLGQNPWYIKNVSTLSAGMGAIWALWRSSEQKETKSLRLSPLIQMAYMICIIERGAHGLMQYRELIDKTLNKELE